MQQSVVIPGPHSVALASSVAKGHYDTGLLRYERFNSLSTAPHDPDEVAWFQAVLETGASAVTNLALSLELCLKILHFQHTGKYPKGHDVAKLGIGFPEATINRLRAEYARLRADPAKPVLSSFSLRGATDQNVPDGTWPGEAPTYDDAIQKVGAAYIRWRYIFEEFDQALDVSMSFEHLILLVKTVNYATGTYEGSGRISLGSSGPSGET
jgi:hypothetical protein